jgi:hypothetical protein
MRSTKGKGDRLLYSRSPSHKQSKKRERLPDRKPHSSIPSLSRQGKSNDTRLTGRNFSPRRRSSSPPTPLPRRKLPGTAVKKPKLA